MEGEHVVIIGDDAITVIVNAYPFANIDLFTIE